MVAKKRDGYAGRGSIESLERRLMLARAVPVWGELNKLPQNSNLTADLKLDAFEPFTLNAKSMRASLANAPLEDITGHGVGRAASSVQISIPTPEGKLARFDIVESSIMEPALAAKFPQIKTYSGYGVDDRAGYIRLDYTPLGFHAQVLSPNGAYYIDPYYHLNQSVYASYYHRDVIRPAGATFHDPVHLADLPGEPPPQPALEISTGTQLRTYRLACAATGEYTAFFGGTVGNGQAAIVTAINRVTGVYELELSIRMTLVGNNSNLVYTNGGSDPYNNNNGGQMLGQNQSNVDFVIGNANYDIGHVFSTGGGGIAGLAVVGKTNQKAQGVTGLPNPTGDSFYIDFVAHEMGHQFGAEHSFNGPDAQRWGPTAYEVGSGSTIMSYAGVLAPNNLQAHSDPIFNSGAFDQIISYVDVSMPGTPVRTNTGNSIPVVNAGIDWIVPQNTPFLLTGSATDGNGDPLTYLWEERDLGPAQNLSAADNGSSPLFRVQLPATSPSRMFPKLASVLAGITADGIGERLPTTDRLLFFRLTVRDNRAGGGGVNSDEMAVATVPSSAAFAINSFNSSSTVTGGSFQNITWIVAGTTASPFGIANVKITMSTDGGNTFPITLAANTPNDGAQSVQMPFATASTEVRFRIEPIGGIFFDINNANLTITSVAGPSATPGTPDLAAATDTGSSNSDDLTNRNNSNGGKTLTFSVPGTVAGATVKIFADGMLLGSGVAVGTSTNVTTAGITTLIDGPHDFTATQIESGKPESPASTALSVTIDTVAPQISAATQFLFDTAPHQLYYQFNEAVSGSLSAADFVITNLLTSDELSKSLAATSTTATLTFPSQPDSILPEANYNAFLDRQLVTDTAGNVLSADNSFDFFFVPADFNHDRIVDITDLGILATNWQQTGMNFTQGNVNYDNIVDITDLGALATLWQHTLPAPGPALRAGPMAGADRLIDGLSDLRLV